MCNFLSLNLLIFFFFIHEVCMNVCGHLGVMEFWTICSKFKPLCGILAHQIQATTGKCFHQMAVVVALSRYVPWFIFVNFVKQISWQKRHHCLAIRSRYFVDNLRNQIKFSFTYQSSDFYWDTLWMVLPGLNTGDSMTLDQMNLKNVGLPLSFRCADRIISSSSCISKFWGYISSH